MHCCHHRHHQHYPYSTAPITAATIFTTISTA
jgi:hypothetical protein